MMFALKTGKEGAVRFISLQKRYEKRCDTSENVVILVEIG